MKKFLFLIKFIVAVILICYLFFITDWRLFLEIIKNARIFYIIIAGLMAYLGVYVSVLRWNNFLNSYGIIIKKLKLYSVYSIGIFLNNFLPTSIGGDFYKVIRIGSRNESKKNIIASIILERGFGLISLFLINLFLILFYYKLLFFSKSFFFLEIFVLLLFIIILFFISKFNLIIKIKKSLIKKEINIFNKFCDLMELIKDIKKTKTIFYGFCYSFIFIFLVGLSQYILFYSFSFEIDFFYILLVITIIQIFGILPISLNSIGITEGLTIFLFSLVNVPPEISLAIALVGRISLVVTSSIGGIFYFFDKKIKY